MPKGPRSTQGLAASPSVDRKGPKRADDDGSKHDADVFAAPWFDAAVTAWGKATAFAEAIEVDLNHVRRMRSGEKPTPIRALIPMLGVPEAILAFVAPLLESIGYVARPVAGPTFTQLGAAVLADLDDGSAITRKLIENAAQKRGWTQAQVAMALRKETDEP